MKPNLSAPSAAQPALHTHMVWREPHRDSALQERHKAARRESHMQEAQREPHIQEAQWELHSGVTLRGPHTREA